jgi:uncharacterized membrane protein
MMDFRVGEVFSLLRRTAPFLVFRFLIYMGITLAYVLVTGAGAGIGYFIGHIGDDPGTYGVWGGIFGFAVVSTVLYLIREYLLYLVKAGHIAVLVELMEGRDIPGGRAQIDHAQQVVKDRFAESSVLFALDQLIKGVLRAFNRAFFTISSILPIPGVQGVAKFINTVVNLSLTYLDEVILAENIRTKSDNPWKSGQTGLILYAQNYKHFLKNAVWLALMVWGLTLVVFLIALAPVAALVTLFPGAGGFFTVVIAVVFAWSVKQAFIEPFGMTALLLVFAKVTEGQEPDPEWEARLDKVSKKFGEIKQKASDWAAGRGKPDEPAGPAGT